MRSCNIHLRSIPYEMIKISILDVSLKIADLKLQLYLPGANKLNLNLL